MSTANVQEERDCFVIAPIGEPGSDVRKHSDQVLKHLVQAVVARRGYRVERSDRVADPGIITSQIIDRVVNASLVVADLTTWNANVFYELAVRHAARKPVIHISSKEWSLPFDVAAMRAVFFDLRDPDSVEEAKEEIAKQLDAIEKSSEEIETPISAALDLRAMRSSSDLVERSLAEIQQKLELIRADMRRALPRPSVTSALLAGSHVTPADLLSNLGAVSQPEIDWEAFRRASHQVSSVEVAAETVRRLAQLYEEQRRREEQQPKAETERETDQDKDQPEPE